MSPLRIIFAGTPEFAATSLQALLESEHQVVAVLTQPDRPSGRGKKLSAGPVKALALSHQIPVLQPLSLRADDIAEQLNAYAADVMVVVAYGLLIPPAVLTLPRYGCINVHGSLLPRWRGAAPIQRAIEAGDAQTGVGIMQMEVGLDTGPVLLERRTPITLEDTGASVHDRLAALGASALTEALTDLPALQDSAAVQPQDGITYAHKLSKDDALLDWGDEPVRQVNRVRAFNPWPVAWTYYGGEPLKIWAAETSLEHTQKNGVALGTILNVAAEGLTVATGSGAVLLTELQLPGKRAMAVGDLLRGRPDYFKAGEVLGER
ncbi:MAG: methionyl-tRNA formyltransferase [Gammaproteobacteria bacterium]|nr:methionyl-tRNA formyltransferase [Gammaproteobacteria bacterium]MBQ0775243.1 methionyl-tRNA formyltransferase [Gammaproteobacteria bacterium]